MHESRVKFSQFARAYLVFCALQKKRPIAPGDSGYGVWVSKELVSNDFKIWNQQYADRCKTFEFYLRDKYLLKRI